jgi:prenyltransferase beta subunit
MRNPKEIPFGHSFGFRISSFGFLALLLAPRLCPAEPTPARSTPAPAVVQDNVIVDAKTEHVIHGALKYLATKQSPNGSWNAGGGEHAVAMTAYTLMAFLAAGNTPNEGEYGKNVNRGMQYLLDRVGPDGFITTGTGTSNMYGHGIATIALGELYGMSRDPRLKEKLEKSIHLIQNCQNDEGGWRYAPRKADADLSVTILQVVALRVAKNSGIDVAQDTIDRAVRYVQKCYDKRSGGFTYQPNNNQPGFARTAAGIYGLQVCGLYDDPMIATGSKYLIAGLDGGPGNMHEWFTYGHFYAAPAMYMVGGDTWKTWYEKVNKLLLDNVRQEGDFASWEPIDHKVGTIYATAVYTMILAMPYHYVPLYQR